MLEEQRKIIEYLNENETLINDLSDNEEITILGTKLTHHTEAEMHSEEVSGILNTKEFSVSRKGWKEISYGNWVDTIWSTDWKPY